MTVCGGEAVAEAAAHFKRVLNVNNVYPLVYPAALKRGTGSTGCEWYLPAPPLPAPP